MSRRAILKKDLYYKKGHYFVISFIDYNEYILLSNTESVLYSRIDEGTEFMFSDEEWILCSPKQYFIAIHADDSKLIDEFLQLGKTYKVTLIVEEFSNQILVE